MEMGTVTVTLYTTKTCMQTHRYPAKLGLHYKDLHTNTQVSPKAGTTLQRPAYKHTGIPQSWDYITKTCIKIHSYPLKLGPAFSSVQKRWGTGTSFEGDWTGHGVTSCGKGVREFGQAGSCCLTWLTYHIKSHTQRHAHTDRHRDTHRDTHIQRHTHTDRHRDTHIQTDTETHTYRHTQRHTHTDRHRHTHIQTDTETHTYRHRDTHIQTDTETKRQGNKGKRRKSKYVTCIFYTQARRPEERETKT